MGAQCVGSAAVDAVSEVEVQTGTYTAQYGAYMGIHINSMTYRVERIQALTGLQLDDPETRVAISIALRARAMLGM